MIKEIYKDVIGYEGFYQVSNLGNIKSIDRYVNHFRGGLRLSKGKMLGKYNDTSGYRIVILSKNGVTKTRTVHKLMAMSFLNHTPCGYEIVVDHIDNDKSNNNLNNIQLISHRENSNKDRVGTSKYPGVSYYRRDDKWMSRITINGKCKYLGIFSDEQDAHLAYQKELRKNKNQI